jgi:hypothetical protein
MGNTPKREEGCAECYWDDYADKWRYQSKCPVHGENKYPRPDYRFGGRNCRCTRTGPENTYAISEACPMHGSQDFTSEAPPVAVPACPNCSKPVPECPPECAGHVAPDANTYRPPPTHYAGAGGLDPWAYIRAHGLDYWQGNIIKYVTRAGKKDGESRRKDLEKARDFLNFMIEHES